MAATVAVQRAARNELVEGLRARGFDVSDPQTNFVWAALPPVDGETPEALAAREAAVVAGLRQADILVRAGTALGEAGRLRISTGTPAEQQRLLSAITQLV